MRGHTAAHCRARRDVRHGTAALAGLGLVLALTGCGATDDGGDGLADPPLAGPKQAHGTRAPQPISFKGLDGLQGGAESKGAARGEPSVRPAPEAAALAEDVDWRSAPDGQPDHWAPEQQAVLERETATVVHRLLVRFLDGDGSVVAGYLFTEQGGRLTTERIPGPERASLDELRLSSVDTAENGDRVVQGRVTDADGASYCLRLRDTVDGLAPVYSDRCPGLLRRPEAPEQRGRFAPDQPVDQGVVAAVGDVLIGGVPWEDLLAEDAAPPLRGDYAVTLSDRLSDSAFRVVESSDTWDLGRERPRITVTDQTVDRAFAHVQAWAAAERSLAVDDDPRCDGKYALLDVDGTTVRTGGTQCAFGGRPTPEVVVGEPQRGDDVKVNVTGAEDGDGETARVAVGFANKDGTPVLERTVLAGRERTPMDLSHQSVWVVFEVAEDGSLVLAEEDAVGPYAR